MKLCVLILALIALTCAQELTGWHIISSTQDLTLTGQVVSSVSFSPSSNWLFAPHDHTCVTAMNAVAANSPIDLFYGLNLKSVDPKQFDVPWWFRTVFSVSKPSSSLQAHQRLVFKGLNYRADIWVNGVKLSDHSDTRGTFRWFEFDVTSILTAPLSAIAINFTRPHNDIDPSKDLDLAITFVDWSPSPPDSNMGGLFLSFHLFHLFFSHFIFLII